MTLDLNQERMAGYGPYAVDGFNVNYLHGLNDLCARFLNSSSVILELGSNDGVSTELFSTYCVRVVAVDMIKSQKLETILNRRNNIEFYQATFESYLQRSNELFDMIYIDGDHTYESVKRDILNFKSRVKPGGYLAGHDLNSETPGVLKALEEVFFDYDGSVEVFSDSSWVIKCG